MTSVLLVGEFPQFVFDSLQSFSLSHFPLLGEKDFSREVRGKEIVVIRPLSKMTKEVIASADRLRFVVVASHGFEHVDTEELDRRKIRWETTPAGVQGVAELAFGFMINLSRGIHQADAQVKKGRWDRSGFLGSELDGKTLGIVGLGPIGRSVAHLAKSFGMKIIATEPLHRTMMDFILSLGIRVTDLETVLKESDIVTLHAHLNEKTHHMIGEKQLSLMKKGTFLINTARGGLIDQKALYKALKSGIIAGAGLDVLEKEPPGKEPLVEMENVIVTPHMGIMTRETQERVGKRVVELVLGA